MKEVLVVIASLFAVVGNVPYIRDVIKNRIHPHPFTWLVWSLVSCITFFGAVSKGAGLGAIPIFVSEVFTVIIFIYSLKNGFKHIRKIDFLYLTICLLSLIPWYLTKDPTVSVIIAVFIDLIAFIPTIRKTWEHPQSESYILFVMNVLRHMIILFTVETYNIATTLHSMAMIITNALMTYLIVFKSKSKFDSVSRKR